MKKTITVFKLVNADSSISVSLSTNKQAEEHKAVLTEFGVETEIVKEKKVIEL